MGLCREDHPVEGGIEAGFGKASIQPLQVLPGLGHASLVDGHILGKRRSGALGQLSLRHIQTSLGQSYAVLGGLLSARQVFPRLVQPQSPVGQQLRR